ncbi:hypothetical protein BD410DRAFT_722615 [Rickenella mellea]|uniref:Distal membrane-arm assembly complex protein 1-like domain-containing protein n=1 Tax=Rickenella mellea TaxID=50990 RepID=A0A4Y7Q5N9_9AGAM|nr:hypothetical protein BD410DRAFT_722615 [Rickenella mellea]
MSERQVQVDSECFTCRVIGSGALAGVGMYALQQSRAPQVRTSVLGRRIFVGIGVGFLIGSVARWRMVS